jgi:hypothetical protein
MALVERPGVNGLWYAGGRVIVPFHDGDDGDDDGVSI